MLYQGENSVPVFNYKIAEKPKMKTFNFLIYRAKNKIYIEATLKKQWQEKSDKFINQNKQLVLELTEKLAEKYLMNCQNSF